MKIECPYCRQQYELKDPGCDQVVVCLGCQQRFPLSTARRLDPEKLGRGWVIAAAFLFLLSCLLLVSNVWLWRQLSALQHTSDAPPVDARKAIRDLREQEALLRKRLQILERRLDAIAPADSSGR